MNYKKPIMTVAALAICLQTLASCATNQGNTLGEISTRLGVPMMGNWIPWSMGGDVNGEVGHPLSVTGPRVRTTFTRIKTGEVVHFNECNQWTWAASDVGIASGELPPGLTMQNDGDISGIPTERGHWIVTMKFSNPICNDNGHRYTVSGAPDVLVQNQGWKNPDECVENGDLYCSLTTIRFHITGSGHVIQ